MFIVLERSVQMIELLKVPAARIRARDPQLHQQIRRSASSIALNLAEGNERRGRDRLHHFRIAAGSAAELRTALRVAKAWGDLGGMDIEEVLGELDQIRRILKTLTH